MESAVNTIAAMSAVQEIIKRGRGRPRKERVEGEEKEKRPRGRPRKEVVPGEDKEAVKRARGRPRKYPIMGKERLPTGDMKAVLKKVDSGFLLKHMFEYFSKLLVLHQELSREAGKSEPIFKRLRILDFQMVEVCKTVLSSEYKRPEEEAPQESAALQESAA